MKRILIIISAMLILAASGFAQDIGKYEYWFDNDYAHKTPGNITGTSWQADIDLSDIPPGIHYFNMRVADSSGKWGSTYRRTFFTTSSLSGASNYEYWFDNDYASKVEGNVTAGVNSYTIDVKSLRKGLHAFNYRMRNNLGEWGSVYRQLFYHTSNGGKIAEYEYWFDNNYVNKVSGKPSSGNVKEFTLNINLEGLEKRGAHSFNMRLRDEDGTWGAPLHKIFYFYDNENKARLVGYRHSLNNIDLGYNKLESPSTTGVSFVVDIPEELGIDVSKRKFSFDGDKVKSELNDSIHYRLQLESEYDWGVPMAWDLPISGSYEETAVEMKLPSSLTLNKPKDAEFRAVKFTTDGRQLYLRTTQEASMYIYQSGTLKETVTAGQLKATKALKLPQGTYYAILHSAPVDEENPGETFVFHLMDTDNVVNKPVITYESEIVSISVDREDAVIYYTTDGSSPKSDGGTLYKEPFSFNHNGVIKTIASIPDSDIKDSDIAELVIDNYKVGTPDIYYENMMIVISRSDLPEVRTFYTTDGSEPTEESEPYNTPFSLTGNATVKARSYKADYHPSDIAEFNYIHSSYVTTAPTITVSGSTVSITKTDEASTVYYGINDSEPTHMNLYESPFTLDGNGTIYAQARKSGYFDSEVISYTVDDKKLNKPVLSHNNGLVTMRHDREDSEIYYSFDESVAATPESLKSNGTKYPGTPVEFARNGVVCAMATVPGVDIGDSDIEKLVVDSYKVDSPGIRYENMAVVITQSGLPGVTTRYTVDGSEPTESSELYGAPLTLSGNVKVRARSYKADYHPSDIAEFNYIHSSYVTTAPTITVSGSTVSIAKTDEASTVYYGINDSEPTRMNLYESPFTLDGNGTIYAQARKSGYFDSEIVSFDVNTLKAEAPGYYFDRDTKLLTLHTGTVNATIKWRYEGEVTANIYSSPIMIEGNAVIEAWTEAPGYNNSDIVTITISDFKCEGVGISYNGRYVTLSTEEEGAEIRYTVDGSNPAAGMTYDTPFDLGSIATVRAVAVKSGYMDSDIAEYAALCHANEERAVTAREGILSQAFGWTDAGWVSTLEKYAISGALDATDYGFIRTMSAMKHLDLSGVVSVEIPDNALGGMKLVSVDLPNTTMRYGRGIFNGDETLCAITVNGEAMITADALAGIHNPNMLMYVSENNYANNPSVTDCEWVTNIILLSTGMSNDEITLQDGYPFYCPRAFSALRTSYQRDFSKETAVGGGCAGWETITLPFDVETISNSGGASLTPFAGYNDGGDAKPFWLYAPTVTGWESSVAITAYSPYLIAMPNNRAYADEYNVAGTVTFSRGNAYIAVTPENDGFAFGNSNVMWPNYSRISKEEGLYVVNDASFEGNAPGSVFAAGEHDVRPFECYLTSGTPQRSIPIFDASGLDSILAEFGVRIWSEHNDVFIFSGKSCRLRIFDMAGQLVRIVDVRGGETCRVADLAPGIYFVGNVKLMVK